MEAGKYRVVSDPPRPSTTNQQTPSNYQAFNFLNQFPTIVDNTLSDPASESQASPFKESSFIGVENSARVTQCIKPGQRDSTTLLFTGLQSEGLNTSFVSDVVDQTMVDQNLVDQNIIDQNMVDQSALVIEGRTDQGGLGWIYTAGDEGVVQDTTGEAEGRVNNVLYISCDNDIDEELLNSLSVHYPGCVFVQSSS